MLDFYGYAESFFDLLGSLGGFLLDTRINLAPLIVYSPVFATAHKVLFPSINLASLDLSVSLAYFLIGGGLVLFLVFRFIKFLLDIIL